MSKRPILLLIACIVAAAVAYRYSQPPSLAPRKETETIRASQETPPLAELPAYVATTRDPTKQIPEFEANAAIANESILTFSTKDDLNAFLVELDKAGIQTSAINQKLLSVKLALENEQIKVVRRLAGKEVTFESNYTILTPFPITPDTAGENRAFEENVLPYLGVPSDNANWGEGTTVAILDTGVLAHKTLTGVSIKHIDLVDAEQTKKTAYAPHGTAVASLIAGQSKNGIAPSVKLISIRVLDSDGIGDTFTLAQGIIQAVDNGADVINMSLGGFGDSTVLRNAVNYASEKGVALVAATGNEGLQLLPYPAAYDNVISVAAIDADTRHARFSNQAPSVDIAAPGVGVTAAWDDERWIRFTGTSASTPYVAGAIAALRSQTAKTSASEAANTLLQTANDTGFPGPDPQTGHGVINLQRALYRKTAKVTDLALAEIYLAPKPSPSGKITVYVTVQNRGTEPIASANLQISIGGNIPQNAFLGTLAPGKVKAHQLTLHKDQLQSANGLSIEAKVVTSYGVPDAIPANDQKAIVIK